MPKQRKTYPDEFKKKLIALVRGGRTPEELGRQFEQVGAIDSELGCPGRA